MTDELARMGRQVEFEQDGHKFIYDTKNSRLIVDGVELKIDILGEDGMEYARLICPKLRKPRYETRMCSHEKLARKLFFPELARRAFLHYSKQTRYNGARRIANLLGSLELRICGKPLMKHISAVQGVVDKTTPSPEDRRTWGQVYSKVIDDYVAQLEAR